jgi:Tfp pilus assembly protein PilV
MKAQSFGNLKKGVATLEILIAFSVLVLSITAVILVVFQNQSISIDTQTNDEALYKAQALLEKARADSRQDFSLLALGSQTTSEVSGPLTYTKTVTVSADPSDPTNPDKKLVTSLVGWPNAGRNLSVTFSTLLSNPAGGNQCSTALSGDWSNPQHYDFPTTDLIAPASGNHSNGLGVSDVIAYRQKMYLTAISTGNFKNTFYIFDLPSNPGQLPSYLGSLDNAATTDDGINALAVANGYAYLANAHDANFQTCTQSSACAQLQVVNVSNATAPAVVKNYKLPGVLGNMTSTAQAVGKSILYANGYVYLGLTKTASGPEFNIIDVHDPLNPSVVGSYSVGRTVNSIIIKGNYAYLSTDDNANELLILDITNKASPMQVGGYNAPGFSGFGYGRGVSIVGNTAYFGRSYVSNAPEFYTLDITNPPSTLPMLGSKDIGTSANNDSVNGITVRDYLAFLLTNKEFQIWNVTNPSSITSYATISLGDFTQGAGVGSGTTLDCTGNYFYIALTSPQGNNKDVFSVITPYIPSTYSLSNSGNISVVQGSVGSNTVSATVVSGYPPTTSFSVSGLPIGATASFSASSCTPTCNTTLILSTTLSTQAGTYPITVTGTGGITTTFNLIVTLQPFDYFLSTPSDVTVTRSGATASTNFTASLLSGASQAITFTNDMLPSGVSVNYLGGASCSPTCGTTLTFSASAAATLGSKTVTLTGTSPTHTTTFNLTVVAPAFSYVLSNVADVTLVRGGASVVVPITATMNAGAVGQSITFTPPNPVPSQITSTPSSASCTPSAAAPYTCTVSFSYKAVGGSKSTNNNQQISATPGPLLSNKFKIIVN